MTLPLTRRMCVRGSLDCLNVFFSMVRRSGVSLNSLPSDEVTVVDLRKGRKVA